MGSPRVRVRRVSPISGRTLMLLHRFVPGDCSCCGAPTHHMLLDFMMHGLKEHICLMSTRYEDAHFCIVKIPVNIVSAPSAHHVCEVLIV